jgi:hypothetical protein
MTRSELKAYQKHASMDARIEMLGTGSHHPCVHFLFRFFPGGESNERSIDIDVVALRVKMSYVHHETRKIYIRKMQDRNIHNFTIRNHISAFQIHCNPATFRNVYLLALQLLTPKCFILVLKVTGLIVSSVLNSLSNHYIQKYNIQASRNSSK